MVAIKVTDNAVDMNCKPERLARLACRPFFFSGSLS